MNEPLTDLDERRERPCGQASQPHFDLKATDISADLVVDLWVKIQGNIRAYVETGMSPTSAVEAVRQYYFMSVPIETDDPKLRSALAIADQMRAFTPRKLAD